MLFARSKNPNALTPMGHMARSLGVLVVCLLACTAQADVWVQVEGLGARSQSDTISGDVGIYAKVSGQPDLVIFELSGPVDRVHARSGRMPSFAVDPETGRPVKWDTSAVPAGAYTLTVTAVHNDARDEQAVVRFTVAHPLTDTEQNTIIDSVDEPGNTPAEDVDAAPQVVVVGHRGGSEEAAPIAPNTRDESASATPDVRFHNAPGVYTLGSGQALQVEIDGTWPADGDIIAIAYSFDEGRIVDDFAHAIDLDSPRIQADRLDQLPTGRTQVQLLVRRSYEIVEIVRLELNVQEPAAETQPTEAPEVSFVDFPTHRERGDDSAIAFELTGPLPEGGDVLVLAWSYELGRMVSDFAFVVPHGATEIPAARLDLLPEGRNNVQLLVRVDNETQHRVTDDLTVQVPVVAVPPTVRIADNTSAQMMTDDLDAIRFHVEGDVAAGLEVLVQAWSVAQSVLVDGFAFTAPAGSGEVSADRLAALPAGEYVLQLRLRDGDQTVGQADHALTLTAPEPPAPVDPPVPAGPHATFAAANPAHLAMGSNRTLAYSITGDDLADHDVVIQAWSVRLGRLVDSFSYTTQAESGTISAARLALLPEGDNYIQILFRDDYQIIQVVEHKLTLVADGDDGGTVQPSPGDTTDPPDVSADDEDNNGQEPPIIDIDDPTLGDGGDDNSNDDGNNGDSADHGGGDGSGGGGVSPWDNASGTGFTLLPLVENGRVIYVSSDGDDSNDGRSPGSAVRTPDRGYDLLRDGYPDQLRFRAGDVFTEDLGTWRKSGRSANAPMVIGVYGEGDRPRFDVDNRFLYTSRDTPVSHLAIQGLYIRRPEGDPYDNAFSEDSGTTYGVDWLAPGENILFEDCRVEYFAFGMHFRVTREEPIEGLTIRRNIIRHCWNSDFGNSCGIKMKYARNLLLEDNLLDHNGWLPEGPGIPNIDYRDEQCHNVYLTPRPHEPGGQDFPSVVRGNIFARGASHGIKGHPGGVMEHNLFVGNAIGGFMQSTNSRISHNVVLDGTDLAEGRPRGWGLEMEDMDEGIMEGNIIAHRDSEKNRAHAFKLHAGHNTFRGNIVYNWSVEEYWYRDIDLEGGLTEVGNFLADFPGSYIDPNRDVGTYHATLGREASTEAFLEIAANRTRGTWGEGYSAQDVNAYIRAGFEVVPFD